MPAFLPSVHRLTIAAAALLLGALSLGCRGGAPASPPAQSSPPAISRTTAPEPAPTTERSVVGRAAARDGDTVYVTQTGKKYHRLDCPSLSKSRDPLKLSAARGQGYEPCRMCYPDEAGSAATKSAGPQVYVTKSGKKYHALGCASLSGSRESIPLAQAKRQGYTACEKCAPPK